TVGEHSALAGKAGISGSSHIGKYCMIGGAVGLAGHLTLADQVNILGMTLVSKSIPSQVPMGLRCLQIMSAVGAVIQHVFASWMNCIAVWWHWKSSNKTTIKFALQQIRNERSKFG